ncbi:uncharacterized protein LOC135948518 [Cloeon dipterum]|uniref:uncharacterized protein LOC135948518 n=1 Tax=Cloeon dipterum TaxID=197152 RepID=UPI0032204CE7
MICLNRAFRFASRMVFRVHQESTKFKQPLKVFSTAVLATIPLATPIFCSNQEENMPNNSGLEELKLPEENELSLRKMLKHSSYNTVDSALQILLLTSAAISEASQKYRECVGNEVIVLNQELEVRSLELNDLSIALRVEAKEADSRLQDLVLLMQFVEKLVDAAAEVSFLTGAEQHSFALSNAAHEAKRQIAEELEKNKEAETELRGLQAKVIRKTETEETKETEITIPDPIDKQGQHIMHNNF